MTKLNPAIIYAAKSTEDKRASIPTQLTDCSLFAEREGLEIVADYQDEAKSAYHGSRGDGLAQARDHAERLAAEHGSCSLIVQHSDRLARGDGIVAQHLVELLLWARKAGVRIRSCQDDSTGENLLMAVVMGERNHEDSRRKAEATAAGKRRAMERGEWVGNVPDGYMIERTPVGSTIARRIVMDAERRPVYELIWGMVLAGASVNSIVRTLNARGYLTAPHKAKPRPWTATRVGKVIVNPFYAGLSVLQGEIVSAGNWPAYIDAEDWQRIRRERSGRARYRSRPVGRPPTALLAGLARCECGGAMVIQRAGARKDGTRRRTYTCTVHMHRREDCSVGPFDADEVERIVLGGLDRILTASTAWADAVLAARQGERKRIETERDAAQAEVTECNMAIKKLGDAYDRATLAGNADEQELATIALAKRRETLTQATTRLTATLDALATTEDETQTEDADAATARLWRGLSGDIEAAREATGDAKALRSVLAEYFEAFTLGRADGRLRIVPVLTPEAAVRGLRDALDGMPSNIEVHAYAVDDADDPDAALAIGISGPAPLPDASDQPGTQPPSRLPHNTQPGSWRGTAGGNPRRSRRGAPGRALLFRS